MQFEVFSGRSRPGELATASEAADGELYEAVSKNGRRERKRIRHTEWLANQVPYRAKRTSIHDVGLQSRPTSSSAHTLQRPCAPSLKWY